MQMASRRRAIVTPANRAPAARAGASPAEPLGGVHGAVFSGGEDERLLRRAMLAAVAAHGLLLAVYVPAAPGEVHEPPVREVFPLTDHVVRQRPVPPPPADLPPRPVPRVPIPHPGPVAPEPIRDPLAAVPPWSVPETEGVFVVPPPPPLLEVPADEPVPVGGDVVAPIKLHAPPPPYPPAARAVRREGIVVLQAVIGADGLVRDVVVLGGPAVLDRAAAAAVREWRFTPATRAGRPVAVYYNLTVRFTLQGG